MDFIDNCAPGISSETNSCYTTNQLKKMYKILYNEKYNNDDSNDNIRKDLIKKINDRLMDECDNEICWKYSKRIKKELTPKDFEELLYRHKAFGPIDDTWLSNYEIMDAFKRYEQLYKDFMFLGSYPCDFDIISNGLFSNYDYLKKITKGVCKYGLVLNTDNHKGRGKHWIAIYYDFNYINQKYNDKKGLICYFNSSGSKPEYDFKIYIDKIINRMKDINGIEPIYLINKKIHQKSNSECGVYSSVFIIKMLEKEDPEYVMNHIIKDKYMMKFRQFLFLDNKKYNYE